MEKSTFSRHYKAFRLKLKEMRERAGLTQREFAKRIGRDHTLVARIEQGQRRVDIVEFYWLCLALKVDPLKATAEVVKECQAIDRKRNRPG